MTDPEYAAALAAALEHLRDLSLPENVGAHLTPEDQKAMFVVIMYHRMGVSAPRGKLALGDDMGLDYETFVATAKSLATSAKAGYVLTENDAKAVVTFAELILAYEAEEEANDRA